MSRSVRRRVSDDPAERPGLLLIGVAAVAVAVALMYVAFTSPRGIPGQPHYDLTIQLRDFANLGSQGADVRIAGKRVGQTLNARLERGVPTVDLQLDADVARLPDDTVARLRPRGLLGPLFVELTPGTSKRTLPDGGRIGVPRTSTSVQLSDVLDTLDPRTRHSARLLLQGLGGGFAGRGDELNAMNLQAPAFLRNVSTALHPLVDRRGITSRLIASFDAFGAALEPVREEMADGFADARAGLRPFVAERAALQRTLDVAPEALTSIRGSLARTDVVLASTTRFARSSARFTAVAPPALRALTRTLRGAREPLVEARVVLDRAREAVRPTLALTDALNPVLPRLRGGLQALREPSRILGTYSCGITGWPRGWRAFLTRAPQGQTGPLGPATMLRTVVASPGGTTPGLDPQRLPDNAIDDSPVPGPCPAGSE